MALAAKMALALITVTVMLAGMGPYVTRRVSLKLLTSVTHIILADLAKDLNTT